MGSERIRQDKTSKGGKEGEGNLMCSVSFLETTETVATKTQNSLQKLYLNRGRILSSEGQQLQIEVVC